MYSSCAHAPLSEREHVGYKWLVEESPAYEALKYIVMDKQLLNDRSSLNKFKHSGQIEVYHSLIDKYYPKRLSFTYEGMYARTQLAVLDHNCGVKQKTSYYENQQIAK